MNYLNNHSYLDLFLKNKVFFRLYNYLLKNLDYLSLKFPSFFIRYFKILWLSLIAKVIYIVENINWSVNWDGKYITSNLKKFNLINAEISSISLFKNKILHFGAVHLFLKQKNISYLKKYNKIVVTWFHINPNDYRTKYIPLLNKVIDILHTSNIITMKKLIELGFNKEKIIVIPLGVDLKKFYRYSNKKKRNIKKKYKIPLNKIIIGSFQKDGVGWGNGLKPKLVKGPDIFYKVIKKLNNDFKIHVLLTGPARGYIKKKLKESKIPYTHLFLKNYLEIVDFYNILDLYIITSRAEGGPKALLECLATGVPLISTKVGMAPEIIKHGYNGYLTNCEDIENLYRYSKRLLMDKKLRNKFILNGLKVIQNYSWEKIAYKYYKHIYKKLLMTH
ncbi:MAG: glycosyltransferase family 4 protein [Promethearchaeota archaeon]